ncbi:MULTISPECIES: pirin [unclassified Spirosoma]|uniref:pirin n=1 Tax=unclassified Spirosoma TaxID=2621999 RepID=UPI000959CBD7|nr:MULTISPECIES: pirin [unclassified Spirosoma]MBN8820615.1 pirin [Spirosoma sp.]OJW71738.1 MAG: pirin [Spirosoma sp. 48-14]
MDTQTQAQIYLADQRGCSQFGFLRSYHSFNFGSYSAESREPFGALQVLNDDALMAGHSVCMQLDRNTDVVILPLVGGLEYKSDAGNGFLEAGQVLILSLAASMNYEICNPYETETINYLAIWLINPSYRFRSGSQIYSFDFQTTNSLLPLFDITAEDSFNDTAFRAYIGRYGGRQEGIYPLYSGQHEVTTTGVYVFVLHGAFEVQNRLLHEREGLALMDIQHGEVAFEALSNDAMLLLLEVQLTESSYN